jgi:hypothetical protein
MWQHRQVVEYVAGCRVVARRSLLAKGAAVDLLAERVHELVGRSDGYLVDVRGVEADRLWPEDSTASAVAAVLAGASWGSGATAQRQLARRYRGDTLIF